MTEATPVDLDAAEVRTFLRHVERRVFETLAETIEQPTAPKFARWLALGALADVFRKISTAAIAADGEMGQLRARELVRYMASPVDPTPGAPEHVH